MQPGIAQAGPAEVSPARTQALADMFVALSDSLVGDYDAIDLLDRLVHTCVTYLGVDAAGVMLSDRDDVLRQVASSTESSRLLELLEIQRDEGPCLEAFRTARTVVSGDLEADAGRWPHFAARAVSVGFRAVTALPIRLRSHTLGAVNLFMTGPGRLHRDDERLAQSLADAAAIGILQHQAGARKDVVVRQLQQALDSRVVIEQAKGLLAQAHSIGVDHAFDGLRRYARSHNLRLAGVATDVVTGRLPPRGHPDGRPPGRSRR